MKKNKRREHINRSLLALASWVAPKKTGAYIAKAFMTPKRYERPEWEKQLLATARKIETPSGRKIYVWGENAPRVLLIHGWEGRGTQLGAFVEPLLAAGYQVMAWDGPAHGDSPGAQTHLLEFASAIQEDAEFLGPIEAYVAHSMGAAALMLAAERGLKLSKAILIASPSQWLPAVSSLAEKMKLRKSTFKSVLKSLEEQVGEPVEVFDVLKWDLKNKNPLLILHDEKDKDVPASEFERLVKAFPEAKNKLFSGLGHRKILRDTEVISHVVGFIKEAV
ncbi:MAG: alpha/beta hydrolase [Bdellovibrionota bacterium]